MLTKWHWGFICVLHGLFGVIVNVIDPYFAKKAFEISALLSECAIITSHKPPGR